MYIIKLLRAYIADYFSSPSDGKNLDWSILRAISNNFKQLSGYWPCTKYKQNRMIHFNTSLKTPWFLGTQQRSVMQTFWKKRKSWLPAFSPFPRIFSTLFQRQRSSVLNYIQFFICKCFQFGRVQYSVILYRENNYADQTSELLPKG